MASTAAAAGPRVRGLIRRFLATPRAGHPLVQDPAPAAEMAAPEALTLFLGRSDLRGSRLSPTVAVKDEIVAGHPLGTLDSEPGFPSPVSGTVTAVRQVPDVRGGKPGLAVSLQPTGNGTPPFPTLDWRTAEPGALRDRLREAGMTGVPESSDVAVVVAADPEPGISSSARLLLDDPGAAVRAAGLLARVTGAARAVLAVTDPHAGAVRAAADEAGVSVLVLRPEYPATLPAVVARAVGADGASPAVVSLADAIDALEAVELGRVPSKRLVTVIGPDGAAAGNFRVPVGTRLGDVLAAAGVPVAPGDRIVTGGLFRGLAQYSLDAAVDRSVSAVAVVKAGRTPDWSDEPCVNCGTCLDVCPEGLQAHQLARLAEFGLFDRTPELGLEDCIECGLCATVCPARRPLLQRIRLAKREVAAAAMRDAAEAEIAPPAREPDPLAVPVAAGGKEGARA